VLYEAHMGIYGSLRIYRTWSHAIRPLPVHLARTHGDCAADFGGRHFVGVADAGTAAFVRYNSWQSDEVQRLL